MPDNQKPNTHQWSFWVLTIIASLLLLVANSAVWLNRTIFNTTNFTTIVTTAIESESSRTAMANEITDRLFATRPALGRIIDQPTTRLIGALLGTDLAAAATEKAVSRLQINITSSNPQPIVIDLTNIKFIISRVITITGKQDVAFNEQDIPDQIVLLKPENVPNIYNYSLIFLWLAPLAFGVGLGFMVWPYINKTASWITPLIQGIILWITGFIGLSLGPLFKPPLLANIDSSNTRVVVGNIYSAFITTFNQQTITIFTLGLLLCLISAAWWITIHWTNLRQLVQSSQKTAK